MGIDSVAGPQPRAVFLDRDGVLNRAVMRAGIPYPPANRQELELIPEAPRALAFLKAMGFLLLVVTNQPDVARGTQSRSEVEAIHDLLRAQLPIDEFFVCYHDDRDQCDCRKPKPGLLLQARSRYGVNLEDSFLIGDRWKDIDAGRCVGCQTIWVDYSYAERGPSAVPSATVPSLGEAVAFIGKRIGKSAAWDEWGA